jgi:hypothetical protein
MAAVGRWRHSAHEYGVKVCTGGSRCQCKIERTLRLMAKLPRLVFRVSSAGLPALRGFILQSCCEFCVYQM